MNIALKIATLGPIGHLPKCPGTFGSVPGIALGLLLNWVPTDWGLLAMAFFFALSVYSAQKASEELGEADPSEVVIDEALGMALAIYQIKIGLLTIISSFILFRLLDILKPPPVRQLDTMLKGGFGIVMDDVAAGIMANLILRAALIILKV